MAQLVAYLVLFSFSITLLELPHSLGRSLSSSVLKRLSGILSALSWQVFLAAFFDGCQLIA